jgi:hypothetical protein
MTKTQVLWALRLLAMVALTLLLCAFHGFVGFHKAFSTYEELVQHSAWTMHLPMWLGRTVGWVEMVATAILLAALPWPRLARTAMWICLYFAAMEVVAGAVHHLTQDGGSLTQNALAIFLTLVLAALHATRPARAPQ